MGGWSKPPAQIMYSFRCFMRSDNGAPEEDTLFGRYFVPPSFWNLGLLKKGVGVKIGPHREGTLFGRGVLFGGRVCIIWERVYMRDQKQRFQNQGEQGRPGEAANHPVSAQSMPLVEWQNRGTWAAWAWWALFWILSQNATLSEMSDAFFKIDSTKNNFKSEIS